MIKSFSRVYSSRQRFMCLSECRNKRLVLLQSFWTDADDRREDMEMLEKMREEENNKN